MAKITDEQLRAWRGLGVKSMGFFEGEIAAVEFFQRDLLDVDSIVPSAVDGPPTERPPGPEGEDGPPNTYVPPAIARILKRGSVS